MLENRMVIDEEWGELEYGVPAPRKMSAWEREEYEDDIGRETFCDSAEHEGAEEPV